jgi:type VII secretion protein EccB
MPLTLSNSEQNSGHLFYNRRLVAAVTRLSVRMKHDDRKQRAAVLLGFVLTVIGVLLMVLLRIFKPTGLPAEAAIIGNRDTGAVYAVVDGSAYPALNLTSARLITGSAAPPKWVRSAEIDKYPTGPLVGIAGIADFRVSTSAPAAFAACDIAPGRRGGAPTTTAIAGPLTRGDRADALGPGRAVLASHGGKTYVIWGGKRSQIDVADRVITVNLGLDPGATTPVTMSNALFDALPATEPLTVPVVPDAGARSPFGPGGAPIGSVIEVRDAAGTADRFYAVLARGVQPISKLVADLLRTANSYGQTTPRVVSPDQVVNVPQVDLLNVGHYPATRLRFIDTAANPVTCIGWQKARTDRQATVTLYTGLGLPVPAHQDRRAVRLVRDDRDPSSTEATDTLILPGAANLVAATSAAPASDSREGLWWIAPQGTRYGISPDKETRSALAVDPKSAVQAPWPLLRMFAPGPTLSKTAAMVQQDTVTGAGRLASLPTGTP